MKPLFLLMPGILNDAELWSEVLHRLGPEADARVADFGQDATIAAMAERAWTQLADVPPERPLVLAGFSLGGYVALEMLARPQRPVKAAVLVSTSAQGETPESAAARAKTLRAFERDFPRTVEGIAQWASHQPSEALLQRLKHMMLRVGPEAATRQNLAAGQRSDHRAALAQLKLPVTVLCGLQDRITTPAQAQDLAALIPGATLEWVPEVGHMLPLEQPEPVARALVRWLDASV